MVDMCSPLAMITRPSHTTTHSHQPAHSCQRCAGCSCSGSQRPPPHSETTALPAALSDAPPSTLTSGTPASAHTHTHSSSTASHPPALAAVSMPAMLLTHTLMYTQTRSTCTHMHVRACLHQTETNTHRDTACVVSSRAIVMHGSSCSAHCVMASPHLCMLGA